MQALTHSKTFCELAAHGSLSNVLLITVKAKKHSPVLNEISIFRIALMMGKRFPIVEKNLGFLFVTPHIQSVNNWYDFFSCQE